MKRIKIQPNERYYIFARDEFTCQYCGQAAPDVTLHVDHLIPVARAGENSKINLITSCSSCNLSKQAKLLDISVIREKQEGIIQRTKKYEKFLKDNPLKERTIHSNHLHSRPKEFLKNNPKVTEPLKPHSIHPDKRHALEIALDSEKQLNLQYLRKDEVHWKVEPVVNSLMPKALNLEDYKEIQKNTEFKEMDRLCGLDFNLVLWGDSHGFYLIEVEEEINSIFYAIWASPKEIELAMTISDKEFFDMSEDSFYGQEDTW